MPNPLVQFGTLNRLIASVSWANFPALNVTASFLNRDGIRLALDGEATRFLPALAGAVTSPEPYQMITLTINLLKTQTLAAQYKLQQENQSLLGNGVVAPRLGELAALRCHQLRDRGVRELAFSGEDAGFAVTIRGYYLINSSLWS